MDRCALFVDAGYALGDGAMAVHGTRNRDSVSWDYASLVQVLGNVARDRTGLPLLRCYWYEATVEGRRTAEHETLADLPGVKLRLGRMRPGHREGVESEIHRDLTTLARNRAVSDALIVSADEDLTQVISEVQDQGLRVILVQVSLGGSWSAAASLRQECDDLVEISAAHLRPSVELVVGAEPAAEEERQTVRAYASRTPSNGHGPGAPLVSRAALPASTHAAAPAIYTGSVIAEYQRAAQPALGQPGPSVNSAGPISGPATPTVTAPAARPAPSAPQPGITGQPGTVPAQPAAPAHGLAGPVAQPGQPANQGQPGAGGQQGAAPQLGTQHAMPAQPGMPGQPGQPLGSVPVQQSPGQAVPGLPQRGAGHHAAPSSAHEAPSLPGPVHHGHHELAPQAGTPGQPGTSPGLTQPYQAPGSPPAQPQNSLPVRPPMGMAPDRAATGPAQPGPAQAAPGQPVQAQPGMAQPGLGQPGAAQPGMAQPGMPSANGSPAAAQPTVPAYQAAPTVAPGFRGQGPDPMAAPPGAGARMPQAPQGQAMTGPAAPARQPTPAPAQPGQPPGAPGSYQAAGIPGRSPAGPVDQRAAQQYPAQLPGPADNGAYVPQQGPHSGPQPAAQVPAPVPQPVAVSLADAVQAAHGEGFNFGQTVARDAPALWLEAVLARKPRMPSDLEARLLQDSSLPIDSLLHDEVRHALRRGFWDALERVRH